MKIAILGYAAQGKSAFEYWNNPENQITICDQNKDTQIPQGATARLGDDYLQGLDQYDLLIRTPILHPKDIVNANNLQILDKVWSNTNEFLKVCPTKNIIGVTGTKGKGTTSTLIAKMLQECGKRVHLGGNIGTPPLEMLKDNIKPEDWVVLELANFQLIDLKYSPPIAVCLMVVPEHLNWHEDMEEYIAAKQQLFMHQTEQDTAIYYADDENSLSVADATTGKLLPYFEKPGAVVENNIITINGLQICPTSEIKLLGTHNWQNACAAVTTVFEAMQGQLAADQIASACGNVLKTFGGLPHRLQLVRQLDSIKFYNDSFAATPDAAAAAMQAIPGKKVMILGGFDRQLPLQNLASAVANSASSITKCILIGQSAQRLAQNLEQAGYANYTIATDTAMPQIVLQAKQAAQPNDSVVLSPGFASFDMFKNFEDRGLQFNQAVNSL